MGGGVERKQEGPAQQRWVRILFPCLSFDLRGAVSASGGAENPSPTQMEGRGQGGLGGGCEFLNSVVWILVSEPEFFPSPHPPHPPPTREAISLRIQSPEERGASRRQLSFPPSPGPHTRCQVSSGPRGTELGRLSTLAQDSPPPQPGTPVPEASDPRARFFTRKTPQ